MTGGDTDLEVIGDEVVALGRLGKCGQTHRNQPPIPGVAVLVGQEQQVPARVDPGGEVERLEQHQCEESVDVRQMAG